ncbi:MAG: tRNA (adenosine(37)-N6)-threonylcarbamoyltransferase complex dimerization subunit type 1 TsaB [Sphingobacteriia bacterium]|nr:tRNA (adenosine(37)-N6)-threonylcarbamoyltransferase complex dimerization subunit type 1 TsaB [Sphingobacteriia bacterium]
MALILNIDTALENASVVLAQDENILAIETNAEQKNHAAFLQPAIQNMCNTLQISLNAIDAVSVVYGPGSYTGLRVAMASAKGICYALNKPLITINTLDLMAFGAISTQTNASNFLYCPMIDARRMEVFTALYDAELNYIKEPFAAILDKDFLSETLRSNRIVFFGNGAQKIGRLFDTSNAYITNDNYLPEHLIKISLNYFQRQCFQSLAYSEPYYLKDFYSTQRN